MKKALYFLTIVAGTVMIASAQSINIGGTLGGVPISVGTGNGGSINIGVNAPGSVNGGPILQLLALAQTIVVRLVPFAVGLAIIAFFWFLVEFIWKGREDAAAKTRSLSGMGYSLLALFVMVSIWGIIGLMGSMLGVGQGGSVPIPGVPVPR